MHTGGTKARSRRTDTKRAVFSHAGIALVIALGTALTSCAAADAPLEPGETILPGPGPASTTTVDTTILYAAGREPTAVMEAKVGGTLALSEGGCWVVDDGETQIFVQFPYGSKLTPGGQAVDVPGLGIVAVGDTIDGGGGYGAAPADAPQACDAPGQEMVFWQTT